MSQRAVTEEPLEEYLAQRLQRLYLDQLGHYPSHISCQLADKTLAIGIEGAITKPEQLLLSHGQRDLARRVRHHLEQLICPHLQALMEQVLKVGVTDVLIDTHLDRAYTSILAVLSEPPPTDNELQ